MQTTTLKTLTIAAALAVAGCARVDKVNSPSAPNASRNEVAVLAPTLMNVIGPPSVPGAVPAPAGLRACFAGDGNGLDIVNNNLGVATGTASFTGGKFGQAFDFLALGDGYTVQPSASLNFGASGTGITMTAWIYGRGTMFQAGSGITGAGPIVEYNNGAHMWQHSQQNDPQELFANLAEGNLPEQWHIIRAPGTLPLNGWYHTAVTYDKGTGLAKLYINGIERASQNFGVFSPNTTTPLHIGKRVTPIIGPADFTFNGAVDEVQIYDRGLTAAEIAQIAGATGTMCVPPPVSFEVMAMPPVNAESGVPLSPAPTVAILDANNNIVSNATTAVTATIASGNGTLIGTTTVNAVNGIATFDNLAVAGDAIVTIGFGAAGLPPEPGTVTVSFPITSVQVARQLGISTQPIGAPSGSPLATQPIVEIRDAAGLRFPGQTNPVTVSIASGPVGGTLSGTTTVNAVDGRASFTNLALTGAGTYTLNFTSPNLTSVVSANVVVAGLPATQLGILTAPAGAESGVPFTTQPVIEIRAANGTRATTATGTVTAQILTGSGTLAGTVTVPIVNGLATFSNLQINGYGAFTLRFISGTLTPVTSPAFTSVQVVRQLAITSGPAVITTDVVMNPPFVLEIRDAAGIRVASSNDIVRMSLISGAGSLAGDRQIPAVNGVVTYSNVTVMGGSVSAGFNFWVIDANTGAVLPVFAISNMVTVLANNTNPPALLAGLIRHGPTFNAADIEGSLQIINAENVTFNGNARMSGTLYLQGTPEQRLNGQSAIGSVTNGTGSATPTNHTLRMNGQARLGTLAQRTAPGTMPVVAPPATPAGTRNVVVNSASDAIGAWATVRNFTMNGNAGTATMPGGAYGDVTINGQNTLVLGVAGSATPTVYSFQKLVLNGGSTVRVVGPVVVTVGNHVALNGSFGAAANVDWLLLKVYREDFTLNGGSSFNGIVIAPDGKVTVNGNSSFIGGLAADDLTLNGNHIFRVTKAVPTP